jgi:uncharacterized membrane protein
MPNDGGYACKKKRESSTMQLQDKKAEEIALPNNRPSLSHGRRDYQKRAGSGQELQNIIINNAW